MMPFKHNAARRHRIPKARYRIRNWPAYEAGLKRRGDLTLWVDETAVTGWAAPRRESPGGQRLYSDVAIRLVLTLRLVFHLALRQAEVFARSVLRLLNLDLAVPDHTTLSRRGGDLASQKLLLAPHAPAHLLIDSTGLKLFGQGEWHAEKHGRGRRSWRKLHLVVDADTGEIVASTLTDSAGDDSGQVPVLLHQVAGEIASVTADGAYDGDPVYQAVAGRQPHPPPAVVIPPRSSAVLGSTDGNTPSQRDRHIQLLAQHGRMGWQKATGYGRRSLVETAMGRYKSLIGPALRARSMPTQRAEVVVAVAALNKMIQVAKPISVHVA